MTTSCRDSLLRALALSVGFTAVGVLWAIGAADPAGAAPAAPAARQVDRHPVGHWDATVTAEGTATFTGWAWDADAPGRATVAVLTPNGFVVGRTTVHRPDVWLPGPTGFSLTVTGLPPGPSAACVGVANAGPRGGSVGFGCRAFTVPAGPVGSIDFVRVEGDQVVVGGWGAVPGSAESLEARILLDGRVTTTRADLARPDLVRAGFVGERHGFAVRSQPLPPGRYPLCVGVASRANPTGVFLGCRDVLLSPPTGRIDVVSLSAADPPTLTVAGWAADADLPNTALDVSIGIDRLDDLTESEVVRFRADGHRPDVAAALRLGPHHGYSRTFGPLLPGTHRVCVQAHPVGLGPVVGLGCRTVVVPAVSPQGALDTVTSPARGSVRVRGWIRDPETPASIPVTIRVGAQETTVPAAVPRPDVAALPGAGPAHGFDVTFSGVPDGVHQVCVSATGVGRGGPTALPCGTSVMGPVRVSAGGSASAEGVGPAASSPLARIDRDAGISTRLSDGSVLWLFGDSAEPLAGGGFRYFVNNTAAWAPAGSPSVTRDGVVAGDRPARFATPTAAFPTCPPGIPNPAMWPLSAVSIPVPGQQRDRVLAYFQNVCLGPEHAVESRGVALVEWTYDRSDPPSGRPIEGTVLTQRLFDDNSYGNAAVIGDDGLLYAYACEGSDGGWLPDAFGECTVARVDPSDAGDPDAYRFWDGGGWSAERDDAVTMPMPDGVEGVTNPVATLTVTRDAALGVYVMAYSPWPGYTHKVAVRVATTPIGPWTAPVMVELPGCDDHRHGTLHLCYAATAQPAFSVGGADSRLGIGFYDQLVAVDPNRGQYRAGSVAFHVVVEP